MSAVLRVWLAVRGGQQWWPDEARFNASLDAVRQVLLGHSGLALQALFGSADHVGFKVLGVVPALAVTAGAPLWLAAIFFGAFSVASIYVVWRIALLTSGEEQVAWWAAFFAATSVSLFYFGRHLLPYDAAMFFGLYAILVAMRDPRGRSVFAAGVWAGVGFMTYNGYWLFCGAALLVAVIGVGHDRAALIRRGVLGALGLLVPIVAGVLLGLVAGNNLLRSAVGFAHTVNLGDFDEGWSFVGKYFWATEGWLAVLWLLALAAAVFTTRRRAYQARWLGALLFIYVGLGVMSTVAHEFVVYGRIARCLVPFIALACGAVMADLAGRAPRASWAVAAVLAAAAAVRFAVPLAQWFPDEFATRARVLAARHAPVERLRVVNAYSMYRPVFADPHAFAATLFARPHPLQYRPFLYENLNRAQRRRFRTHDLTMRLVRLRPDAAGAVGLQPAGLGGFPGPLRLVLRLPLQGTGYGPLLVTGLSARRGDYLSLVRLGPGHYRLSLVHWSAPERCSADLTLDEAHDHVVDVALGSLLPPAAADAGATPSWAALRRWAYVAIDGRPVFDGPSAFHVATPGEIDLGCNYLGGVTTDPQFRGEIRRITPLPPDEALRAARAALHATNGKAW